MKSLNSKCSGKFLPKVEMQAICHVHCH